VGGRIPGREELAHGRSSPTSTKKRAMVTTAPAIELAAPSSRKRCCHSSRPRAFAKLAQAEAQAIGAMRQNNDGGCGRVRGDVAPGVNVMHGQASSRAAQAARPKVASSRDGSDTGGFPGSACVHDSAGTPLKEKPAHGMDGRRDGQSEWRGHPAPGKVNRCPLRSAPARSATPSRSSGSARTGSAASPDRSRSRRSAAPRTTARGAAGAGADSRHTS